jgi:putative acetyltransferase
MTEPLFTIRKETPADIDEITRVTAAAFLDHPKSDHTEHLIINELRRCDALTLSLVAQVAGRVAGHVAFSPVTISDGTENWYGLGPLSVEPHFQEKGVGQALVQAGLAELRKSGASGCVLAGSPEYYGRFGFAARSDLRYVGVPAEYFVSLSLDGSSPRGEVTYHRAFEVTA